MKTIEVSDEMYDKLIALATEMTEQDPRCTRMPHIFQIRDWKRVYDWNLNGDTRCWIDRDGDFVVIEEFDEFREYLREKGINEPEDLKEIWDDHLGFDLDEWIEENAPELEKCTYSMEPVYTNSFLTAKAAKAHLDSNYYHYHVNADVYLNHAWRNPEAETVSEFLCGLIGKKMHT
jgi:hypothetical protein